MAFLRTAARCPPDHLYSHALDSWRYASDAVADRWQLYLMTGSGSRRRAFGAYVAALVAGGQGCLLLDLERRRIRRRGLKRAEYELHAACANVLGNELSCPAEHDVAADTAFQGFVERDRGHQ
jgi:hypothetical protein